MAERTIQYVETAATVYYVATSPGAVPLSEPRRTPAEAREDLRRLRPIYQDAGIVEQVALG